MRRGFYIAVVPKKAASGNATAQMLAFITSDKAKPALAHGGLESPK